MNLILFLLTDNSDLLRGQQIQGSYLETKQIEESLSTLEVSEFLEPHVPPLRFTRLIFLCQSHVFFKLAVGHCSECPVVVMAEDIPYLPMNSGDDFSALPPLSIYNR